MRYRNFKKEYPKGLNLYFQQIDGYICEECSEYILEVVSFGESTWSDNASGVCKNCLQKALSLFEKE
jgi:hypothetical protein